MQENLTEFKIKSLRPEPGKKRVTVFDTKVTGLCVRATDTGHKSFYVMTRDPAGRQKWAEVRDGNAPVTALAKARELAPDGVARIKNGFEAFPRLEPVQAPDNFLKIRQEFIERWAKPRNRSWQETERILKTYVGPSWDKREIVAITRRDVIELLEKIADKSGGYMSNRTLAAIRRLFAWALERDIVSASPVANIKPVAKEVSRDRILSDAELAAFWKAAGDIAYPWGPFGRVLALTGQRRSEVASMRWCDLNLEADKPLWTLPREATKADRAHEVPLSNEAVETLKNLRRFKGEYVFTTGNGMKHVRAFSPFKKGLDAKMREYLEAELQPWRLHDLRRSMASALARLGQPPHIVSAILNHSPGRTFGVTAVYLRHSFGDEKRAALTTWARYIATLATPQPDNVFQLRESAQ